MAAKKQNALQFAVAELKKNKNATFDDIRTKARQRNLVLWPVVYGRAKALVGLVPVAPRGSGKQAKARSKAAAANSTAPKKRGRPLGSTTPGSKSERIRELLGTGMSGPEIAKKVGCSVNLVYAVKAKAGGGGGGRKRGPAPKAARAGRPAATTRAAGATTDLDGIVQEVARIEEERNRLRDALEKVRSLLDDIA